MLNDDFKQEYSNLILQGNLIEHFLKSFAT
jgi:hypothetical protein